MFIDTESLICRSFLVTSLNVNLIFLLKTLPLLPHSPHSCLMERASVPHIKIQSKEDITIRPSLDISSPSLSSLDALVRGWEQEILEWGKQRSSVAGYPQRWGGIPQPLVASMYASPYIGDNGFLSIMSSFNSESGPCHNLVFLSNLLPFRYGNMGTTEVNLYALPRPTAPHTNIHTIIFI